MSYVRDLIAKTQEVVKASRQNAIEEKPESGRYATTFVSEPSDESVFDPEKGAFDPRTGRDRLDRDQ